MVTTATPVEDDKDKKRSQLNVNEILQPDYRLTSPNGNYMIKHQTDGNLVVYDIIQRVREKFGGFITDPDQAIALWSSRSSENNPKLRKNNRIVMLKPDGNLVMIENDGNHDEKWSSHTTGLGNESSVLIMQDDGNAVLFSDGLKIWETDSRRRPEGVTNTMSAGDTLRLGESLISSNKRYRMYIEKDGNLIIRDLKRDEDDDRSDSEKSPYIFETGYGLFPKDPRAKLKDDGNLVVYDGEKETWASKSSGSPNAILTMMDDGNAVITSGGKKIWSSKSAPVPPPPEVFPNKILVGGTLAPTKKLVSANGKFYLEISDQLIKIRKQDGQQLWEGGDYERIGITAQTMKMRNDGELELTDWGGGVKWTAGTAGKGDKDSFFILQDNGDFALMKNGQVVWHTNAWCEADGSIHKTDRLSVGERLWRGGQCLTSPNGKYRLVMEGDGKCVLREGEKSYWDISTNNPGHVRALVLLDDDRLLIEGGDWSSNTRRRLSGGKAVLILQDDGNLVLKSDGLIIWSNNSKIVQQWEYYLSAVQSGASEMKQGQYLEKNKKLESSNGQYTATLQSDGDWVIHHKSSPLPLWVAVTKTPEVTRLLARYDGNVITEAPGHKYTTWESKTRSTAADWVLKLNDDGNITIPSDHYIWSSGIRFPVFNGRTDGLRLGDSLLRGQSLTSRNGEYSLTFTSKGHLCLTTKNGYIQYFYVSKDVSDATHLTFAKGKYRVGYRLSDEIRESPFPQMKTGLGKELWKGSSWESNLGKRNREEQKRWEEGERSGQYKAPVYSEASFNLQDDGNFVIMFENEPVWSMYGLARGSIDSYQDTIYSGQVLHVGDCLFSMNMEYVCNFQGDGNVVVYWWRNGKSRSVWQSNTSGSTSISLTQHDYGNLILRDKSDVITWQHGHSRGNNVGAARTTLQNDGNLVTYIGDISIWARWSSSDEAAKEKSAPPG